MTTNEGRIAYTPVTLSLISSTVRAMVRDTLEGTGVRLALGLSWALCLYAL